MTSSLRNRESISFFLIDIMVQDLIVCLQEATLYFLFKKSWVPKHPEECFVNLPCECQNPGKEIQCEECPHLESCLSNWKLNQDYLKKRTKSSGLR